MLKRFSLVLISALLLNISAAYAEDSFWADDSSPQGQIGLVWYEDILRSGEGASFVVKNAGINSAVCDSVSDPVCAGARNVMVEVMLPPCDGDKYEYCIEGMSVGNSKSKVRGNYIRSVKGPNIPADKASGIPFGSTASIWEVPGQVHTGGNDRYSVGAWFRYIITNGRVEMANFEASIVPFREITGPNYRTMQMKVVTFQGVKGLTHDWHVGNCIWQEPGLCGVATRWSENASASLSLRLPNRVTGWLHGRLDSPEIAVTKIDSNVNQITVSGKPVTVQGSAPKVNVDSITPGLMKVITRNGAEPLRSDSGYVWQLPPAEYTLDWFNAWLPVTHDKADGFSDYWNFKSIPGNFTDPMAQKCLVNKDKLVGLVTTNALWYSGNPPVFKDSQLNYKVAALHFNPDGITPFLGSYDLVINSSAARCLYGFSSAPVQASISVVSASGENQIATTTVNESDGWLKLSAKGFTFSTPSINVKLSQNVSKSATILCKKGKSTKKITGIKPVCPQGFSKS